MLKPIVFTLFLALPALAAEKAAPSKPKHPEPTKEQREEMAKSHEAMAQCLRSDKAMEDCWHEMMKSCEGMGDMCPMHHHMGSHGKHHGHASAHEEQED